MNSHENCIQNALRCSPWFSRCLLFAGTEFELTLLQAAFEATLVITGLTVLFIIYCFSGISRMKKRVSLSVYGDEEDELEVKQYRTFTDVTLANTVSTILSIIAIGISIVTGDHSG